MPPAGLRPLHPGGGANAGGSGAEPPTRRPPPHRSDHDTRAGRSTARSAGRYTRGGSRDVSTHTDVEDVMRLRSRSGRELSTGPVRAPHADALCQEVQRLFREVIAGHFQLIVAQRRPSAAAKKRAQARFEAIRWIGRLDLTVTCPVWHLTVLECGPTWLPKANRRPPERGQPPRTGQQQLRQCIGRAGIQRRRLLRFATGPCSCESNYPSRTMKRSLASSRTVVVPWLRRSVDSPR